MTVGILSDTHGACVITQAVAEQMLQASVEAVFHCGDFGGTKILKILSAVFSPLKIPIFAVLGNVDGTPVAVPEGVELLGRFGTIDWHGKKIALLHGDDQKKLQQTVLSGEFDFVFSGHLHTVHDYTKDKTRCINPGSVVLGRGSPDSFALLDLNSGALTIKPS